MLSTTHSRRFRLVLVLMCTVVMTGCGGCRSGTNSDEQSRKTQIGVILPLTGSGAVWGQNAKKGIDLAVEEINRQGGVGGNDVEVIYEDSQTLPKFAVAALNKHIDVNQVEACIVDMVSSNVLAMAPVANREEVVLISPGASSPKITHAGSFVFRNWPSDALQGELNAQHAYEKMRARTASILFINNEYGVGLQSVFSAEFTRLGGTIEVVESFEQGASDFRSSLTKLKATPTDVLYILAYPKEWPLILVQAKELGINVPILGTETTEDPTIIENAGDAANGVIYSVPEKPSQTDERVAHFLEAFREKYGEEPGITADAAYDAVYLLVDAIRENGYDGPRIRDYLLTVKNYHGAAGATTFDENGDCIKPFIFKRIEGRKAVVIQ